MAREPSRAERNPTFFGSIDPFCWIAVIPLLAAAVFTGVAIMPVLGLILAVLGLVVLGLDGWINWRWHTTWERRETARGSSRSGRPTSGGRSTSTGRNPSSGRTTSGGGRPTAGRR
ncbi:hypothetical protein SAMN04487905_102383 [Actinopolyspora xinjiangensis]|uniref:Uncharacterized protein n=1 Tax=Actinopolyspora xinjiangensis TaxID=405564 RepID=A0A1H0QT29_9ACTN|nr:hypothetical protein [Actinopolyspora xinjiangensis]SDP20474.1 hypothetical protein SAMN04487905_102383 [Actinopolyspora xinjiangensis]